MRKVLPRGPQARNEISSMPGPSDRHEKRLADRLRTEQIRPKLNESLRFETKLAKYSSAEGSAVPGAVGSEQRRIQSFGINAKPRRYRLLIRYGFNCGGSTIPAFRDIGVFPVASSSAWGYL